jgi:hypothetical protein
MDIYKYFNSKAIADHCRETGKTWTPFEMAVIIARSYCTVAEKHSAWLELIETQSDMPTPENVHVKACDSLHAKLTELIDYEERITASFKKQESNTRYHAKVRLCDRDELEKSDCVFGNLEETLDDVRKDWDKDEVCGIEITRFYANNAENKKGFIKAILDFEGNIYELDVYDNDQPQIIFWNTRNLNDLINQQLQSFFIDIPVPFKRGDILTARRRVARCDDESIFVLDSLDRDIPNIQARILKGDCDDMHMMGNGFFADDKGVLYSDHLMNYDSFEYYTGELQGKERLLHYVNLFIEEKISLSGLLAMQCRIMIEHLLNEGLRVDVHERFIPENLFAEKRNAEEA